MRTTLAIPQHWWIGVVACCAGLLLTPAAVAKSQTLSDETICDAVEDALYFDKAVPFDPVDVRCDDGVVTLTGTAGNLLAKRRATRLAETVKGVRAIVNRITVAPRQDRSPAELRENVLAALLADAATDSYELDAVVDQAGYVTVTGQVDSWQEKQLAARVVMGVSGVKGITNDVTIDYETERPDREIKPEVMAALEWDALVDHEEIDVTVDHGTVALSGTVGSAAEKRQARYDAWVAGVEEVDATELTVEPATRREHRRRREYAAKPAGEIRDAIRAAYIRDPRVPVDDVRLDVRGSVVTVRGVVGDLKARRAAAQTARNTVGVSRVENRLKVRPMQERTTEQIEDAVRRTLLRDPYVDRYEINVRVVEGTAYLSGAVDSYFEKAQAEDAASRVKGVVDVSNALVVAEKDRPIVFDPYVYDWNVYEYGWYDYAPPPLAKSDREIKEDIEEELWWSPFVDSEEINVTVENGTATLTGVADDWAERRAATENALEGGAILVHNELDVIVD